MKLRVPIIIVGFVFAMVAAPASGGVGVWTLAPTSSPSDMLVVGPGGTLYADCGLGVCESLNHGGTWQTVNGPAGTCFVCYPSILAVDSSGAIYVAVHGGGGGNIYTTLYVSRDGGATWTMLLQQFGTNHLSLSFDPLVAGSLWLLGGLGSLNGNGDLDFGTLSVSTDGGAHWTEGNPAFPFEGSVTAFALDPRTIGRLYAARKFSDTVSSTTVYVSGDSGATWTRSAVNVPGVFVTMVVDPFHASTIVSGGPSGIFRSTDGGQTFSTQSVAAVVQIVADPLHEGRLYAATPANGVLTSSDGGATWAALNTGLTDIAVRALALDGAGGYLYAATGSGVFVNLMPGPATLVLNAAHPFTVTLSATDPRTGQVESGVAIQVNDLWGYFSIPAITSSPGNPEVFVKLLDGTAINGEYWFFYGGLTNLEYTLTVTAETTGTQKTYTNPAGSECGGSDTAAFAP